VSDNKLLGIPARANDLVAAFDERKRSIAIVKRTNCPFEQALFLARGGTNAEWYACATVPPVQTEDENLARLEERITDRCPPSLTPAQREAWLRQAILDFGLESTGPAEPDSAEAKAIRAEFAAFCARTRGEFGL